MAYVTLIWAGNRPQRPTDPPRSVSFEDCVGQFGLRQTHYFGANPPRVPSDRPELDDYRDPYAVAVSVKGDELPEGWRPGWYVVPAADLPTYRARHLFLSYPVTGWDEW